MKNQPQDIISSGQEGDYSDSGAEIFLNLAPTNDKKTSLNHNHQHTILAKMKRLIGDAYLNKNIQNNNKTTKKQKKKNIENTLLEAFNPQQDSFVEYEQQSIQNNDRERSRDKFQKKRITSYIIDQDSQQKMANTGVLSIQKDSKKQNSKLAINQSYTKSSQEQKQIQKIPSKYDKFAEIQKQLLIPVDQLPIIQKSAEEEKQEKREKKRLDRMMEKKYKDYKVGKVKDETSNCVFNGIEDYFM